MSPRQRLRLRRWSDRLAFTALGATLVAWALTAHPFWKPTLHVRSCGGNTELLERFIPDFERRHRCHVVAVAAPVQYLLELAAGDDRHIPDVIVGRSGPGWALLERRGLLDGPPQCFAIDPLVLATAPGNPHRIHSLQDLGREGLRVLASPGAMRPKGRVVGALLADVSEALYPGLADRWERNTTQELPCGRTLAKALRDGRGDVAVLARSQTALPPLAGACEAVPIPPHELSCLRNGRSSMPQSVGRTRRSAGNTLAEHFVADLVAGGYGHVAAGGYIPIDAPDAAAYEGLRQPTVPTPMAARQMALAKALEHDGADNAALRRYLYAIHVFGPSRWDAEAWYHIGALLQRLGRPAAARTAWQTALERYPTRGHKEWLGILAMGDDLGTDPEAPWLDQAAAAVRTLPPGTAATPTAWERAVTPPPIAAREGDTPKGARRVLAVATDLLRLQAPAAAARDALKVVTLHHPSPHSPAAWTVTGTALARGSAPWRARQAWQQVLDGASESPWAAPCARALAACPEPPPLAIPASPAAMPPFESRFETHSDRALAYAGALYDAGMPLYALKECLKIVVGLYGQPAPAAEAHFRAGICLRDLGRLDAARLHWQRCRECPGDGPWARRAEEAQRACKTMTQPRGTATAALDKRLPKAVTAPPADPQQRQNNPSQRRPQAVMRLHLGEELLIAGVLDDDQALLEFLKVLHAVESPPHLAWTKAVAHLRAAQALALAGRIGPSRDHARQADQALLSPADAALAEALSQPLEPTREAGP